MCRGDGGWVAAELRVLFLGVGVEGGSPEPRVEAPPWVCVCVGLEEADVEQTSPS